MFCVIAAPSPWSSLGEAGYFGSLFLASCAIRNYWVYSFFFFFSDDNDGVMGLNNHFL